MRNWMVADGCSIQARRIGAGGGLRSSIGSSEFFHGFREVGLLPVRSLKPVSFPCKNLLLKSRSRGFGRAAAPFLSMRCCFSEAAAAAAATELDDEARERGPCLMLHRPKMSESESTDDDDYYHFFSLAEQKELRIEKNLRLPWQRDLLSPDDAVCVGSSHGWLAFIHPRNCSLCLFNPFIESSDLPSIPLPPIETLSGIRAVVVHKLDKQFIFDSVRNGRGGFAYNLFPEQVKRFIIQKLVLSSAPSLPSCSLSDDDNCTVMAIHSDFGYIAFCKPWDERWTALQGSLPHYDDIVYFSKEGRFYAIAVECLQDWLLTDPPPRTTLEAWDLSDPSSPKSSVITPLLCGRKLDESERIFRGASCHCFSYLVDSSGDLLLVLRYTSLCDHDYWNREEREWKRDDEEDSESFPMRIETERLESEEMCQEVFDRTYRIGVYKLNFSQNKWESVECLGERALFVGSNYSFSLSTRDYPDLRNNSVYFTDDYDDTTIHPSNRGFDRGLFNLEDNCNTPYHPGTWLRSQPNPVWLLPNTHL